MARPLRIIFEDACYHIISRGIRDEKIFYENKDRYVFLDKIQENFEKFKAICFAYCLMNNHYHLFIRTHSPNLPQLMHSLNTSYTNWFKAKHKIKGPLFQCRYKSFLVEKDKYAFALSAYIHLNPIRAGITTTPEDYKWSSFNIYTGKTNPFNWLETDFILSYFDKDKEKYKEFVYNQIGKDLSDCIYKGCILGGKNFIKEIQNKIKHKNFNEREIPQTKLLKKEIDAKYIVKIVSDSLDINSKDINKREKNNIPKKMCLYLINKYTPLSLSDIGLLFDMDYSAVSQSIRRFKLLIDQDERTRHAIKMITKRIKMSNVET